MATQTEAICGTVESQLTTGSIVLYSFGIIQHIFILLEPKRKFGRTVLPTELNLTVIEHE